MREKTIRQLIEELQTFEDDSLLVCISEDGITMVPANYVAKRDGKCVIAFLSALANNERPSSV